MDYIIHNFDDLKGRVFSCITANEENIIFEDNTGKIFILKHFQDCCESVYIESIIGDLQDLINSPILMAEESSNSNNIEEGSETWTFYKLATIKGYVDIRFYGESTGYYSETVDLIELI